MNLIVYVYIIYIIFFICYCIKNRIEYHNENQSKRNIQIFLDEVFFSKIYEASKNYHQIERMYKIFNILTSYYNLNDIAIFDKKEKEITFCYANQIKENILYNKKINILSNQYYQDNNLFFNIKNYNNISIIISSYQDLSLELNDSDNLNIKNIIYNYIIPLYNKEKDYFKNYSYN